MFSFLYFLTVAALAGLGGYAFLWIKKRLDDLESEQDETTPPELDSYTRYLKKKWDLNKETIFDRPAE